MHSDRTRPIRYPSAAETVKGPEDGAAESGETPNSRRDCQEQDKIVQIKIEGNLRVETELIGLNISSKVGEPLSTATVREDIKKLYKLGNLRGRDGRHRKDPGGNNPHL